MILRGYGIGAGDEVIVPSNTYIATWLAASYAGATPIPVEPDERTYNINPVLIEAAITPRTKAIIAVHLYGQPADMDAINAVAKKYQLKVIEDAAQAFGSHWNGKKIGSFGDLVSFSFQANKNLTTIEGGCLVLNNAEETALAEKLRLQGLTRQGIDAMDVDVLGGKDNLTDVNAVIGLEQLKQLPTYQTRRAALARQYFDVFRSELHSSGLDALGLELPVENFTETNWHMFQVILPLTQLTVDRAQVMTELKELGIGTGVHYPIITGFTLYKNLGYKTADTPHAQRIGGSILTLPLFPAMTDEDIGRIVKGLAGILKKYRKN